MKKKSVLIIDDSEADRYLLKRFLQKIETVETIYEAENGQVALDFFRRADESTKDSQPSFQPDLVFLDINMPILDGFEFLEAFSKLPGQKQHKPIVFMMLTSSGLDQERTRALDYPLVKDYLTKGAVDADLLRSKIGQHCNS